MKDYNKKYFIKDFALKNVTDDFFGHWDFSQNIVNILKTQDPPYNVAILGKWGLGKSSLVNFVEESIRSDSRFEYISINAWKYEKEAFRKVFLKRTWEKLGGKEESKLSLLKEALSSIKITEKDEVKDNKLNWWQKIWKYIKPIFIFALQGLAVFSIITILSLLYRLVGFWFANGFSVGAIAFGTAQSDKIFSVYDELIKSFNGSNALWAGVVPLLIALIKDFMEAYNKKTTKSYNLINPAKTTDDYENLLLEQLNKEKNKEKIIVTLIDDLDRLNTEKIVDALDAIKSFSDINQCVFIVPFDEEKIIEALEESKKCNKNENAFIISELFLDKLFQFRIYLPGVVKRDLIPYAKTVCIQECPDLVKLCEDIQKGCFNEEILPILIHYHIDTPRQIKKVVNSFANNLLVLNSRVNNNKISIDMNLDILRKIAKISVLQADFSKFYNKLFAFPTLIKDFAVIHESIKKNKEADVSQQNKEIYENIKKDNPIDFELLLDFINNNRHIKISVDEIRTLIYISDSKSAMRAGGKEQELARLLSIGDGSTASKILSEFENPCQYLSNELLEGQLNRSIEKQYLVAIYEIFEHLENNDRKNLANVVSKKTEIALNSYSFTERESISICDVLPVYIDAIDKNGTEQLICLKLDELILKKASDKSRIYFSEIINSVIENRQNLSEKIKEAFVTSIIMKIKADKVSYNPLDFAKDFKHTMDLQLFNDFFKNNFFEMLIEAIDNEDIIEGEPIKLLFNIIDIYCQDKKANELPSKLYPMLKKYIYLELLYDKILEIKKDFADGMPLLIEAISQIVITEGNSQKIIDLLEELNWNVFDGLSPDIDAMLNELNSHKYIINILEKINDSNQISLIPETIKSINTELLEGDRYHQTFASIMKNYDDNQIDDLIDKLTTALNYSSEAESLPYAISVFNLLKNVNGIDEKLVALKTAVITMFNSYYSRYPKWALMIVEVAGYKHTTDTNLNNTYIDTLNKLSASNMELFLKGWRYITGTVPTTARKTMFINIFSKNLESFEDYYTDLYYALKGWKSYIFEDPEHSNFYEQLLINCLGIENTVNDVIQSIEEINTFQSIPQLFNAAEHLNNDQQEKTITIIIKNIREEEDKCNCIYEILSTAAKVNTFNFDNIIKSIFSNPANDCYRNLLNQINENDSLQYLLNLLQAITLYRNSFTKTSILNLIKIISAKGNAVNINQFIEVLKQYDGFFISGPNKYELKGYLEVLKSNTQNDKIMDLINYLGLNKKEKKNKGNRLF